MFQNTTRLPASRPERASVTHARKGLAGVGRLQLQVLQVLHQRDGFQRLGRRFRVAGAEKLGPQLDVAAGIAR